MLSAHSQVQCWDSAKSDGRTSPTIRSISALVSGISHSPHILTPFYDKHPSCAKPLPLRCNTYLGWSVLWFFILNNRERRKLFARSKSEKTMCSMPIPVSQIQSHHLIQMEIGSVAQRFLFPCHLFAHLGERPDFGQTLQYSFKHAGMPFIKSNEIKHPKVA